MTLPPGKGRSLSPRLGRGGARRPGATQPRRTHRSRRLINTGAGRDGTETPGGAEPGWNLRTGRPRILSHTDVKLLNQKLLSKGTQGDEVFSQAVPGTDTPSTCKPGSGIPTSAAWLRTTRSGPSLPGTSPMDCGHLAEGSEEISRPGAEPDSLLPSSGGGNSCLPLAAGPRAGAAPGRPAAANAARERSRVQTLRHAFLELQKTLPSVPPDTKLSKLDVLLLATTYIAHLTRSLQDEEESPGEGLGTLRGDGYLHPVKKWPMRSRLYIGATGQFLTHSAQGDSANHGETSTSSQI